LIFLLIYFLLITEKLHRTIVALWGALLFASLPVLTTEGIKLGILTQGDLLHYENWEALGLIFGMFTLVAALRESGFFRWLGLTLVKWANFDPLKIFIFFAVASVVLSAFMNSITVLMFMATLTVEVCGLLRINHLPFLFLEICSANIGGSATMVGDPPNIIIGTSFHFSFLDFVFNSGPIALLAFLANLLFFYLWYQAVFKDRKRIAQEASEKHLTIDPASALTDLKLMRRGVVVFGVVMILLALHHVLNLSVAFVGILGASLVLLLGGEKMPEVLERIDWHTLIFFACLFIMVGGLEKVGVLADIAQWIANISGGRPFLAVMIILWVSAILSAFIDNVPFAAAMVPVVKDLSLQTGIPLSTLAWALVLGTDIGGNATPIGASANVVGISVSEKRTGKKITWKEYCLVAAPSTLISILVCSILIYLRYLH
ncbi:MAG: SLC13 family permease, partial [Candidatus Margulisiibacteriota bacterium]